MTTPLLLSQQIPEERSDGARETNRWIKRKGGGGGVICQATPPPRRTSNFRSYTGTRFMLTLTLTFMAASGAMRLGRVGGMNSRSCPHGATTRQAERSVDALWWPWWKSCTGCRIDGGTCSASLSFRR